MGYSSVKSHKEVLSCVAAAAGSLEEQDVSGCMVTVEADFLKHVYELLLAYALTYEQHQVELCHCEQCNC